jgi:hypothetical protein
MKKILTLDQKTLTPDQEGTQRKMLPAKPRPLISDRDRATLMRLRNRLGLNDLIRLLQSDPSPQRKAHGGSRGAPRTNPTRQCLLAVLYHCRLCCKGHITIPAFAKQLDKVVEIKYSRRTPPAYRSLVSLEADLRRGLRLKDHKMYHVAFSGLLFWRFTHVNASWGYYLYGPPHLLVKPKRPAELIEWIDAAIARSGVSEQSIRLAWTRAHQK